MKALSCEPVTLSNTLMGRKAKTFWADEQIEGYSHLLRVAGKELFFDFKTLFYRLEL